MTVTAEQIIRRLGLEPLPARQAAVHRDLLLPDRRARLVPCTAQTTDRRDLPLLRGRPGRYAAVVPQGTQRARAPRPRLHAPAPRADRVAARRVAGLSPRPRRPMVLAGRDDGARLHRFGLRWRRAGGDGGALTGGCRGDRAPCTTLTDGDVQAPDCGDATNGRTATSTKGKSDCFDDFDTKSVRGTHEQGPGATAPDCSDNLLGGGVSRGLQFAGDEPGQTSPVIRSEIDVLHLHLGDHPLFR